MLDNYNITELSQTLNTVITSLYNQNEIHTNRNAVKLSRIGYGIRRLVDPCSVAQIESSRCVVLPPKRGVTVLGSERRERSLQQRYSWWRRVKLRRRDTQGTNAEKPRFPRMAGPRGEPVQRMRGVHRVRE